MNKVLTAAWQRFLQKSAPMISRAFQKACLYPLQPPTEDLNLAGAAACTASMQIGEGKKATKLAIIQSTALNVVLISAKNGHWATFSADGKV